jgi:hypothetical protein
LVEREFGIGKTYMIGTCLALKNKFECGKTNLNVDGKNKVSLKTPKEALEPFAVVRAESAFELCKENLVPIYEEYDKRNRVGEEKTFQMLPRRFATNLLKIEGNAMFPEDNYTESEKETLNGFVEKRYIKSAIVAGKTVYFNLDSKIKKHLISVLKKRA